MTEGRGGIGEPVVWRTAAQGDILAVEKLPYLGEDGERIDYFETDEGVVLVSQTCDLVQNRERVLVAPLVGASDADIAHIKKGRKPLLLVVGAAEDKVADLERIQSVPRAALEGTVVIDQTFEARTGEEVARLAARIARAVSRFAFPDEVHDALKRLHRKISDSYSKSTSFARVLGLIDDFRVSCDDWNAPGRVLAIHAVVPTKFLPAADMRPPDWKWSAETVDALKQAERPHDLSLERLSDLLLSNLESENDSAIVAIWDLWGQSLQRGVLPEPSDEVAEITLEAISGSDFTYDQYVESGALDFSVLSMSEQPQNSAGAPTR